MIKTRETVTGPPGWWDKFIAQVQKNGGLVGQALIELGMNPQTHQQHVARNAELRRQLEAAVEAGKTSVKKDTAERILKAYAAGATLREAAATEGVSVARCYILLEETGLRERYEKVRDENNSAKRDFRTAADWLREQLGLDAEEFDDDTVHAYVDMVKRVIDAVALDSTQLRELGYERLRNNVLRAIGESFKEEAGYPAFLSKEK